MEVLQDTGVDRVFAVITCGNFATEKIREMSPLSLRRVDAAKKWEERHVDGVKALAGEFVIGNLISPVARKFREYFAKVIDELNL